jgi:S-adenosylmethionine decarboxylase
MTRPTHFARLEVSTPVTASDMPRKPLRMPSITPPRFAGRARRRLVLLLPMMVSVYGARACPVTGQSLCFRRDCLRNERPCSSPRRRGPGAKDARLSTFGNHWLVEYFGCERAVLDDSGRLEDAMRCAAEAAGATVITTAFHRFAPQGVSGVLVIAESHLSIHTWPEHGYAAVDFYTCGACEPGRACQHLRAALGASRTEIMRVQRGHDTGALSMRVAAHHREDGPGLVDDEFAEVQTEELDRGPDEALDRPSPDDGPRPPRSAA